MRYQHSMWRAGVCLLLVLAFMTLCGLAFFGGRSVVDGVAGVFFLVMALFAVWSCRKMLDVVIIGDELVVQRRLGSETTLAWDAVQRVELRDAQTILAGEGETRILVDRNHPAYHVLTQQVLDRFSAYVEKDAGTTFSLDRGWAVGFVAAGFVFLGIGGVLISDFGVDFWPGWATMALGVLFLATIATMPRRLVIRSDEIEISGWRGRTLMSRSEVTEARMRPLAGSGQVVVEIMKPTGHRIPLQLMYPGQFRLWVALVAWKRG